MERIATATGPAASDARRERLWLFGGVATAIVAADQLSKALIRSWLPESRVWPTDFDLIRFQHVENSGAAFGILQGAGPFLIVSSVIGVAAVLLFLRATPAEDRLYSAALALVLGGAIGNLIDRVFRGSVTDFIDPARYPAFNLADSAIVVGVFALILLSLRGDDRDDRDDGEEPPDPVGEPG